MPEEFPSFYAWGGPNSPVVADVKTLSMTLLHRIFHLHGLSGQCVKNRFADPTKCEVVTDVHR